MRPVKRYSASLTFKCPEYTDTGFWEGLTRDGWEAVARIKRSELMRLPRKKSAQKTLPIRLDEENKPLKEASKEQSKSQEQSQMWVLPSVTGGLGGTLQSWREVRWREACSLDSAPTQHISDPVPTVTGAPDIRGVRGFEETGKWELQHRGWDRVWPLNREETAVVQGRRGNQHRLDFFPFKMRKTWFCFVSDVIDQKRNRR